jgi:hypothetical protein
LIFLVFDCFCTSFMVVAAVYYALCFGHVMRIFQMLDDSRYLSGERETKSNGLRGGCNGTSSKISSSPHNYDDDGCTQGNGENQCKKCFDSYPNGNNLEALGTDLRGLRLKKRRKNHKLVPYMLVTRLHAVKPSESSQSFRTYHSSQIHTPMRRYQAFALGWGNIAAY